MSMSVNSAAPSARGPEGFDPSKMATKIATKMMSDLDADQDGKLDKKEFVSGLTSKGVSAADAGKAFDAIDTAKSGSIGKADIESAVKSGALKPPPGGPPPGGRSGPPRGAGGPPPGAGGGGSASKTYEAADTNKDGTVSAKEALVYSLKHPESTTAKKAEKAAAAQADRLGTHIDTLA